MGGKVFCFLGKNQVRRGMMTVIALWMCLIKRAFQTFVSIVSVTVDQTYFMNYQL